MFCGMLPHFLHFFLPQWLADVSQTPPFFSYISAWISCLAIGQSSLINQWGQCIHSVQKDSPQQFISISLLFPVSGELPQFLWPGFSPAPGTVASLLDIILIVYSVLSRASPASLRRAIAQSSPGKSKEQRGSARFRTSTLSWVSREGWLLPKLLREMPEPEPAFSLHTSLWLRIPQQFWKLYRDISYKWRDG